MPRVQNVSLGGGQISMLQAVTQISRAQILALLTTPVIVVPAPGPGKFINVFGVAAVLNFGTVKYSATADSLAFFYGNAAADNVLTANIADLLSNPAPANAYQSGSVGADASNATGNVNASVSVQASASYNVGPIVTATLGASGTGYVANDTGTITNGLNDATYKVLTVGAGGAVLTFQITGAGTACTVANGNATVDGGAQPGVGAGFTVNITAVQTGDGTLKVVTYYQIIPVP